MLVLCAVLLGLIAAASVGSFVVLLVLLAHHRQVVYVPPLPHGPHGPIR
jgi:hypothetical protein